MKILFDSDSEINVIGTRHGEKRYEALLNGKSGRNPRTWEVLPGAR